MSRLVVLRTITSPPFANKTLNFFLRKGPCSKSDAEKVYEKGIPRVGVVEKTGVASQHAKGVGGG